MGSLLLSRIAAGTATRPLAPSAGPRPSVQAVGVYRGWADTFGVLGSSPPLQQGCPRRLTSRRQVLEDPNHTLRAQVTEGINLVAPLQSAVAEYYSANGTVPQDDTAIGNTAASIQGKYVSQVSVNAGTITVTFGNSANVTNRVGKTLAFTPYVSTNGDVSWQCGTVDMTKTSLTLATGATAGNTSVLAQFRPSTCK
jgi:type IV pilus assembly protein PilA